MHGLYPAVYAGCIGLEECTALGQSFVDKDNYVDEKTAIPRGSCTENFELQELPEGSEGGYVLIVRMTHWIYRLSSGVSVCSSHTKTTANGKLSISSMCVFLEAEHDIATHVLGTFS